MLIQEEQKRDANRQNPTQTKQSYILEAENHPTGQQDNATRSTINGTHRQLADDNHYENINIQDQIDKNYHRNHNEMAGRANQKEMPVAPEVLR